MKTKMKKLSDKQEKETDILAKRILPKTDFLKVIEHDKFYWNALNQALELNLIKRIRIWLEIRSDITRYKFDSGVYSPITSVIN